VATAAAQRRMRAVSWGATPRAAVRRLLSRNTLPADALINVTLTLPALAAWMLLRPKTGGLRAVSGRMRDAVVGFGGGLVGGLTAMPGAVPTIWCDLRGLPKDQQRGLVQPYAGPDLQRSLVTHAYDLTAVMMGATREAAATAQERGMQAARLHAVKQDIDRNLAQ